MLIRGAGLWSRRRARCALQATLRPAKGTKKGAIWEPIGIPLAAKLHEKAAILEASRSQTAPKNNKDIEGNLLPFQVAKPD